MRDHYDGGADPAGHGGARLHVVGSGSPDTRAARYGSAFVHEAAAIAREAGVRRVVLTHLCPPVCRPGVKERLIAEVANTCEAEVLCPEELVTLELGRD